MNSFFGRCLGFGITDVRTLDAVPNDLAVVRILAQSADTFGHHPELASKTVSELVADLNSVPEAVRTAVRNTVAASAALATNRPSAAFESITFIVGPP